MRCLKPLLSIIKVKRKRRVSKETVFSKILKNQQNIYEGEYQRMKLKELTIDNKIKAVIELVG